MMQVATELKVIAKDFNVAVLVSIPVETEFHRVHGSDASRRRRNLLCERVR